MTPKFNPRTPVVLLRAVAHGALGMVRTLGRMGVPVYVVEADRLSPASHSRYCRGVFAWDMEARSADETIAFLRTVARRVGSCPLLIPTTDDATLFVAEHASRLRSGFRFPQSEGGLARQLSNKQEMYWLAKQHGVPTPECWFPQSRCDVESYAASGSFPVVMKGIDGAKLQRVAAKRLFIVMDGQELLRLYDAFEDKTTPNLLLQQYVPGGEGSVWMFNGYFDERSNCTFGMTGKKIRQCPVYSGATSLGISLPNRTVLEQTAEFMRRLQYRGILDIGYRYDARDGQYKLLDANPRVGATFRLFIDESGGDVVRSLYRDLTGQGMAMGRPVYGRKWIVEDLDAVSSLRYWRDSRLRLGEWLASLPGIQESAYVCTDDLLPASVRLVSNAVEVAARVVRHTKRKFQLLMPVQSNHPEISGGGERNVRAA